MHISLDAINRMQLAELDDLRHQLRLPKKVLCARGQIDPSTYQRWMRHVAGRGGCCPQPRSIEAVRRVLTEEIKTRQRSVDPGYRPAA
jgi:hypothetical protein